MAKAGKTQQASAVETYWREFEVFGRQLLEQQWIFAKTMAHNPHWYTLRRKWPTQDAFRRAVEIIRARGYRKKFARTWYTQIDVNDHFYWTMGAPIDYPNGTACTILINRKPLVEQDIMIGDTVVHSKGLEGRVVPYDQIADKYDDLFVSQEYLAENAQVFGMVGDFDGKDVLDIGCGTGLALDYVEMANSYLGIDPSIKMLEHLKARHPDAETICTTLGAFVPPDANADRYDIVLAVFGTGSYLTDEEIARIPTLLKPGGIALVMFYAPGYYPDTYVKTGVEVPHRPWTPAMFEGTEVRMVGGHVCCIYRKES